jgi:ribonuclease D
MPQSRETLGQLRALPRGVANSRIGEQIIKMVKLGLDRDPKSLPPFDSRRDEQGETAQAAAEVLKLALKVVCEKEGLAPKLVASSSDIDAFAENDSAEVAFMQGWRREVFGRIALDIKQGRAMIGFRKGRVAIIGERAEPAQPKAQAAAE